MIVWCALMIAGVAIHLPGTIIEDKKQPYYLYGSKQNVYIVFEDKARWINMNRCLYKEPK